MRLLALSALSSAALIIALIAHHPKTPESRASTAHLVAAPRPPRLERVVASFFTDYGLPLACGGTLGYEQQGIAHRRLPCGTAVELHYRGRRLVVPVVDRGPYIAGREIDLTGATARAIGLTDEVGVAAMRWRVLPRAKTPTSNRALVRAAAGN